MKVKRSAVRKAEAWNESVKVGDLVEYFPIKGEKESRKLRTRTKAEVLSGHTAVVWLIDQSGCVAVSHCKKVKEG